MCLVAVVACVPYLSLKVAWTAGSTVGIPAASILLDADHATTVRAVNALTVLMDCAVIALALMLTRPWGRRVPAWLLAGPTWVACGLLGPILVGLPLQVVADVLAPAAPSTTGASTFLEPWVSRVVYTGFGVQALALGTLFVLYARRRWSAVWRGRLGTLQPSPTLPALRGSALVAAALALLPLAMQTIWALGSTAGLSRASASETDRSAVLGQAAFVPFTVAAAAGILLLAFRPGRVPIIVPLALAWVGSAALTGWGAWRLFTAVGAGDAGAQPTATMSLVFAVQLAVGLLVGSALGHFLVERSHEVGARVRTGAGGADRLSV